jgi:predicted nucleotidyltransferase/HEPN domain-containing protein
MKTSIDHLPEYKQTQLRAIAELFSSCPAVDKLILFGSHARGDWVEDEETRYFSDYDLAAIVGDEEQVADRSLWGELERRTREIAGRTPVTLIVHDIKFVNREIRIGQYFFADIANEGVLLVDKRRFMLAKPKALNDRERLELAQYNFARWFDSASKFWRSSRDAGARQWLNEAAFLLHQATERYYHAALLVFTGYKERTHDIEKLGKMAAEQHPLLVDVLPKTELEDKRLFDLLKKAYIEARYSDSYRITSEELITLQARVVVLAERVRAACLEKLASFCGADKVRANLPVPPRMTEPVLTLGPLPPLPDDPKDFARWATDTAELSEQRARVERAQGRSEGQAEALLVILRARGLEVPADLEQQIRSCADPQRLGRWLQRAATGTSAAEILRTEADGERAAP